MVAEFGGALHKPLLLDDRDGGERRAGRHRVLFVGVVADGIVARYIEIASCDAGGDRQDSAS